VTPSSHDDPRNIPPPAPDAVRGRRVWGLALLLLLPLLALVVLRRPAAPEGTSREHRSDAPPARIPAAAPERPAPKLADLDSLLRRLREACRLEQYDQIQRTKAEILLLGHRAFGPVYLEATVRGEDFYKTEALYFTSLGDLLLVIVASEDEEELLGTFASIDARKEIPAPRKTFPTPTAEIVVLQLSGDLIVKVAGAETAERVMAAYQKTRRKVVKQALLRVMAKLKDRGEKLRKFLIERLGTEQDGALLAEIAQALGGDLDSGAAPEIYYKLQQLYTRGGSPETINAMVESLIRQMGLASSLPLLLDLAGRKRAETDPNWLGLALAEAITDGVVDAEGLQLLISTLTAVKRPEEIAMLLKALEGAPIDDPRLPQLAHLFLQTSENPSVRQAAVAALLSSEKDQDKLAQSLSLAFTCGDRFVMQATATQVSAYAAQNPEAAFAIDLMKKRASEGSPAERAFAIYQMGTPWLGDGTPDLYSRFLRDMRAGETDERVTWAIDHALSGEKNMLKYLSVRPKR
jgi:hypothetical protein